MLQVGRKLLKEADDMLGLAAELCPQLRLLSSDAGRTGVQVALPSHVAAQHDQHRGSEGELVSSEQCRNQDIACSSKAAVGAQTDASTHSVLHQHLLSLGQAKLPRIARVLDA